MCIISSQDTTPFIATYTTGPHLKKDFINKYQANIS